MLGLKKSSRARGSPSSAQRLRCLLLERLEDRVVPSILDGTILVCTAPSPFSYQDQSSFPSGIVGVDPSTGNQFPVSMGGLFSLPTYICEAPNGQLYVSDLTAIDPATGKQTGAVIQVDPNTGNQSLLATGRYIDGPNGLAFSNGYLYVADVGNSSGVIHNIVEIDPSSGSQRLVTSGEDSIAIDRSPAPQRRSTSAGGFSVPVGIAPAPGNNVYVGDEPGNVQGSDPGKVWLVNLDTGQQTLVSSNNRVQGALFNHPSDIAVDANGNLLVGNTGSASNGYAGSLLRIDPQTGLQTPLSSFGAETGLDSVAVDQNSGVIFVGAISAGATPGMIYAVDPATGVPSPLTSGNLMSLVEGIRVYRAIGPAGDPAPSGSFFRQDQISSPDATTPRPVGNPPYATPLESTAVAAVFALASETHGQEHPAVDTMLRQMPAPRVNELGELISAAI